jgi:hypothetical protein
MGYAEMALRTDPATRSAISVSGHDPGGDFHLWLNNLGPRSVFKINSLVDMLEGCTFSEIKTFRRRWYIEFAGRRPRRSPKQIYTSNEVPDARLLEK